MLAFIEFLGQYKAFFLALHILGVCLGLGGATIADSFFFRFLKDFRISRKEADVMQWMSRVIVFALVLIYLSGAALYVTDMDAYLGSPAFVFKMIIVFIVTINGLLLHEFISPRLVTISFAGRLHAHARIHSLRKIAFAMGAISMVSWYSAFFTAMLKSVLPATLQLPQMLLLYVTVLGCAIFCSQIVEMHLHRTASR